MQGEEIRTLDIPMRLFGLGIKVKNIGHFLA
jgi:hypothetical protein